MPVCTKSLQSCLTLCDPMDHSPPGSHVRGMLQARIPEWVTMPSSRGSFQPRAGTCISYVSCIGRQVSLPLAPLVMLLLKKRKNRKKPLKSVFLICEVGKTISFKNCKLKSLRFSCSESDFSFRGYVLLGVWTEVFTWPCCILGRLISTASCSPVCVCCVLGVYQKTSLVFSLCLWWI